MIKDTILPCEQERAHNEKLRARAIMCIYFIFFQTDSRMLEIPIRIGARGTLNSLV